MFGIMLGLVALFLIGLGAAMYFFQERLVYFPLREWAATPADAGLPYEEIWLETADGVKLSGWFIPAEPERAVVLFFHGNGGNISHRLWSLEQLRQLGLSSFIFDYRGYGHSEGSPSEQGTYQDAAAAWRYLTEERHLPPAKIIIYGESLGGAVAAWAAEAYPPAALILVSTFTSVPDIGAQVYPFLPVRQLSRIQYNTLTRLPQITCPVLIMHSPADEVIPFSHGQRLFAAAAEPKEFIQLQGGHNDGLMRSASQFRAALAAFVTRHVAGE